MEEYKIANLKFSYDNKTNALDGISLVINRGEFFTVCGRSGCGKSTLLRHLKSALTPTGYSGGEVYFNGKPLSDTENIEQSRRIGFIMQDPDSQLVTDKVWHELAFGAESIGMKTEEIRLRTAETASYFGIQTWLHKKTSELSGGQKQLLNLAAVMVTRPSVIILDEPTAQLDPIAASGFIDTLKKINEDFGTTIIISEHRLEEILPISDRMAVMDMGRVTETGTPRSVAAELRAKKNPMYLAMPVPVRVYSAAEGTGECPLTVREGREWLKSVSDKAKPIKAEKYNPSGETAVELKDVHFRYDKNMPDVLRGVTEKIYKGELYAVVGGNGTGKTTCLKTISGILTPCRGRVTVKAARIAHVPQNPQTLFLRNTLSEDLKDAAEGSRERAEEAARLCHIDKLLSRHPYDLSGGEQQRAALAKALLREPELLLLDEPTKGLDPFFKKQLGDILKELKERGVTIIIVSHDIEFCAEYADRCALFFDGSIAAAASAREIFLNNSFYTSAAVRMSRGIIENALTAEDIITSLGGGEEEFTDTPGAAAKSEGLKSSKPVVSGKKLRGAYIVSALLMIVTVLSGKYIFDDRQYYFISLLIILETLIPFAAVFEKSRPRARDIAIISTMCAVAAGSRAVFYNLPQVKPMLAMVIISGIALGGESGFIVGAVSAFVSNMLFGQGAWTPWQMFAMGIIGLLSGLIFKRDYKKRVPICVFGFLSAFFIYGIIMNISSMLAVQSKLSRGMFMTYELSGIPFDLIHAVSTAVFLFIAAKPMLEKLERVAGR